MLRLPVNEIVVDHIQQSVHPSASYSSVSDTSKHPANDDADIFPYTFKRRKRRILRSNNKAPYLLSSAALFLLLLSINVTTTLGFVTPVLSKSDGRIHHDDERANECVRIHPLSAITKRINLEDQRWYPLAYIDSSDINDEEEDDTVTKFLEKEAVDLLANIIHPMIYKPRPVEDEEEARQDTEGERDDYDNEIRQDAEADNTQSTLVTSAAASDLAKGRFLDLCCSKQGEEKLEALFKHELAQEAAAKDIRIIQGAIVCLQRLLVLGMSYGVTMNTEVLARSINHMREDNDEVEEQNDPFVWTSSSSRRLKYQASGDDSMKAPGIQLLAALKRRQAAIGAYELLVDLGVWAKHENLALLRSGVPLRFTEAEDEIAADAARNVHDPDQELEIRQDLRSQKVFTIDSASTSEIDDGLSVEVIEEGSGDEGKSPRYRYWIHIADADRWAPRDSELFEVARKRATSIYLPNGSISMMPSDISSGVMSLLANTDSDALSLGVELAEDGSIIDSSLIFCPSKVKVTYRLTYDEVNEMIEDGIAFNEEWELGQLLTAAQTRQKFRHSNGSSEAFVPTPIPQYAISVVPDQKSKCGERIKVDIQVSNNSGKNLSSVDESTDGSRNRTLAEELPASASNTLVTEMMILAGEALGKWARRETSGSNDESDSDEQRNPLKLPFRSQPKPDYRSRSREKKIMMDLLEYNVGDGYCHAWYARRFLSPVKVTPFFNGHSGLGLECYVQWTSPIRRLQDLQVHAVVKRYLRRKRVMEMLDNGESIPASITQADLGCSFIDSGNSISTLDLAGADEDIDYDDRKKIVGPVTFVMRNSNKYWMLEYIRRLKEKEPGLELDVVVLGCVYPAKRQYALHIYDLGLEWRYSSPVSLQAGMKFKVRIGNIAPLNGQLALVRVNA